MIRETCVALALVVLMAGGSVMASSVPGAPQWSFNLTQNSVPTGNPILIDVFGPPNGTFSVAVNPEPFNSSQPVFDQVYQEPAHPSLANGTSSAEVQINTTYIAIEAYQITVANSQGVHIGTPALVFVTIGTPTQILEAQIVQLQYDLSENASRVKSLLYEQTILESYDAYAVGTAAAFFAITTFLIVFTRTAAAESRLGKKLRKAGRSLTFGGPGYIDHTGGFEVPEEPPRPDPEKIWVANLCDICRLPHTRPKLIEHLMGPIHKLTLAECDLYIKASEDARRRVQRYFQAERKDARDRPAPGTSTTGLDLTDVLGPAKGG